MNSTPNQRKRRLAAIALALVPMAIAASFALVACKNNPSPATPAAAREGPAPVLTATPATPGDAFDGLDSPLWRGANWTPLVPALKETKSVANTRVASLFDADKLYIAFVGVETGKGPATASVWLDTSTAQNGTNVFEMVADASPQATAPVRTLVWHRCVIPPESREMPNYAHPMTHYPVPVKGLKVQTGQTTMDGKPAWTVVFAIPLKNLPEPLQASPKPGETSWRVNLLRQDIVVDGAGKREMVQSNLSPVFAGAQAVMPYRMAKLQLSNTPGAVAARPQLSPASP